MALGVARGTHQQSRVDPSMDGTNGTEANGGESVRSLLSPRTGAGQSEVTQQRALSACSSHNPPSAGPAAPHVIVTGAEPVPSCSPRLALARPPGPEPRSPSLADKPDWFGELPYFWTKVQVLEWISYHVEKNKYDASAIDFSCCNMDGHALCHCTRDQMRLIFGPLGDELYDRLHEISECPRLAFVPRPGSSKQEAETPPAPLYPPLPGHCRGGGGTGGAGGAQARVQAGLGSAPSMYHSPPY